jgi:hypothetical protein
MGLDLLVMAKPLAGHEAEEATSVRQFMIQKGLIIDDSPDPRSLIQRVTGKKRPRPSEAKPEAMDQRYKAITVPAYASFGAPIVGQDKASDDWVATLFAEGGFHDPAVTSLEKPWPKPKAFMCQSYCHRMMACLSVPTAPWGLWT